jgi:hypothetical protein
VEKNGILWISKMTDPCDENKDTVADQETVKPPEQKGAEVPVRMTLEQIIDLTGELEHLNELILLHFRKCGGFTSTESYFNTVQPILDMLEVEIRFRYRSGMTTQQITLIVQDWIDKEIVAIKKNCNNF